MLGPIWLFLLILLMEDDKGVVDPNYYSFRRFPSMHFPTSVEATLAVMQTLF